MFDFFKRVFAAPKEDVHINLPGVELAFNHRLKICFLYEMDSAMETNRYEAFEAYLGKRKYFLQIIVAPKGMSSTTAPRSET